MFLERAEAESGAISHGERGVFVWFESLTRVAADDLSSRAILNFMRFPW